MLDQWLVIQLVEKSMMTIKDELEDFCSTIESIKSTQCATSKIQVMYDKIWHAALV